MFKFWKRNKTIRIQSEHLERYQSLIDENYEKWSGQIDTNNRPKKLFNKKHYAKIVWGQV